MPFIQPSAMAPRARMPTQGEGGHVIAELPNTANLTVWHEYPGLLDAERMASLMGGERMEGLLGEENSIFVAWRGDDMFAVWKGYVG